MRIVKILFLLVIAFGIAACSPKSKFLKYKGPEVTSVQIHKAQRKMYLLHNQKVLQSYDIALGPNAFGHKQFEGDGKTPEGTYYMTFKNPNSKYHLSLYINYPNVVDREFAASHNRPPGGEIFIHGGPLRPVPVRDWTEGCIAVTNEEIEVIYSMVNLGTPVHILP